MMLPDYRVRQRDYLLEITRALTEELDLDKLLGRILHISIEMLTGQSGLIALRTDEGHWRVRVSHGLSQAFLQYLEPYLEKIPPQTEESEISEIPEINRLLKKLTFAASMGLLTGVGLALKARKKVVGVIFIFRSYPEIFSKNDRQLLNSFADQAAIAVQNAQLYRQIKYEKQRMDALLDSAADGLLILTPDNMIERCNQAFSRHYGLPESEIQNKPHELIISWQNRTNGLTLEEAVTGGWPLTPHAHLYIEGDLNRPNQLPLPVGITYAPLLTVDSVLVNIIASVRDITRFRQAEELKSTFISIVSHELKTPVALIKGYVSTLRREDAHWDAAIIQDSLAVIEEESDHLNMMIENLLDASRLQAGGLNINRADVNIPEIVKKLVDRFKTQTNHHEIKMEFAEEFPIILADESRINQVLSNLLGNSIKYAKEGLITIKGQVRTDCILICIKDEGPGIPPEDIPHVFDRFYRAPDLARTTKGAGLGLYLSKAIIEAHGGRIWVDPVSGQGVRICFSLPRSPVDDE